ncbi:MAG: hypothetical protein R3338_00100 [Thermoanaerobaculia bacterium]|nr:hypothetical protein [Thermoanaerobaculia bacterium]
MTRLVEWNELRFLVRGERIEEIARQKISEQNVPIRDVRMRFFDSLLEVSGRLAKVVAVPFRVEIRKIDVEGSDVVVRIDRISAAGLPVPTIFGKIFEKQVAGGSVQIDGDGPLVRIRLDRILPEFVDVTMKEIRISGEGIVAFLGAGGADPPEGAI